MPNDTSAINDIVQQKADEIAKSKEDTGDQSSQQQNQGGGEPSQAEKDAALLKEQEAAAAQLEATQKLKDEATKELLKKFNVDSLEELEEKLGKTGEKELSKEEKEKAEAIREAEFQKFAVEKDIMKLDDFSQLKTLKSRQDAELVFDSYLKDWKEENPDIKVSEDLTEADIEKLAKEDFEKEFKLNSDKEAVKAKGIAKLAKAAAEIRNPLESKFNDAKEQFEIVNDWKSNFPKFAKSTEKIAEGLVPEKVEWFKAKDGEEEIPIEIELSADDRKEITEKIAKRIQSPENYQLFKDGKLDTVKENIADYAEYLISKKTKDIGNAKIAEIFLGRGVSKGSTTGAVNSFATNQAKAGAHQQQTLTEADVKKSILEQPAFKPKT